MYCEFCSKECKNDNSLRNHMRLCKSNPSKQEHPRGMKGKRHSSETKEKQSNAVSDERKAILSKEMTQRNYERVITDEYREKLSLAACKRLSKNSKYSKNTEYKPGIFLESSFEVRTAEILDRLGIPWIKVRCGYVWNDNGKLRRYIPDFYLPEQHIFLDPKNNYLIKKDKRKIESAMEMNNIKVIVLSEDMINDEFLEIMLL